MRGGSTSRIVRGIGDIASGYRVRNAPHTSSGLPSIVLIRGRMPMGVRFVDGGRHEEGARGDGGRCEMSRSIGGV